MSLLKESRFTQAKTALGLCFIVLFSAMSGAVTGASEEHKDDLLNTLAPVMSHITYQYENRKRSDIREQSYAYYPNGKLAQRRSIFGFGKTTLESFKYDESGKLLTRSIIKNGAISSTIDYEYNKDGNISRETEKYPNGTKDERLYEYSDEGLLIASYLRINGYQVETYSHRYNEEGKKIYSEKRSNVGIIGVRVDKTRYKYNASNHLINAFSSGQILVGDNTQSRHSSERAYLYDDKNRLVKERYVYESHNKNSSIPFYVSSSEKQYIRNLEGQLVEEKYWNLNKDNVPRLAKSIKYQYTNIRLIDGLGITSIQ